MKKVRVAVIGGGHLGQIHTRLLKQNPRATLVAVCDPQPLVQQKYIQQFDVRAVSDYRKIADEIEAAVIATPTALHHRVAADLLRKGIHLLIEKPVTNTASEARELVTLAREHACVVQVGHVERFNPAIRSAIERIGQPRFLEAQRLSGFTFRSTDISVVQDLMIHDIDLAQWIVGETPMETRAVGISVFGQNEDIAHARLQFACGAVANLTASRCSYEPRRQLNMFGSEGFASVDMTTGKLQIVKVPSWLRRREFDLLDTTPEQQAWIRERLFSDILPRGEVTVEPANAIAEEQTDWLNALTKGCPVAMPLSAALAAVETADQIRDAIANHRWLGDAPSRGGPLMSPTDCLSPLRDPLPEGLTRASRAA